LAPRRTHRREQEEPGRKVSSGGSTVAALMLAATTHMGGKGPVSGTDYEADAFAYIAAHILAGKSLPWFSDLDDAPVTVWLQKGKESPGDDIVVELRDGRAIEVQAKHGASGNEDFVAAAARLFVGLQRDPHLRGVILVDSSSTGSIRSEFDEDVRRFADGIDIEGAAVMKKILGRLHETGVQLNASTLGRFRLIVTDFNPGSDAAALAQHLLGTVLEAPSKRIAAWELLGREALRVAKRAGRQDASAVAAILKPLSGVSQTLGPQLREQYVDWAIETNATLVLAPLPNVRIDTFVVWDELLPSNGVEKTGEADAISTYHRWEERSEKASVRDLYDSCKLLEDSSSAIVVGGAGGGKSALSRKLVREACEGGFLAFRVSLKQVALAVKQGKSFDDALVESAFQGSGLDLTRQRDLLARADFLIADGLDEAEPLRSTVATLLLSWMKGHPNASVIVTTRPVGHSAGLLPGIRTFGLSALSPGGGLRLASEIFNAALADANLAEKAVERFEEEIATNRHASIAARNPLLLSCMVALSIEGRPLPRDVPTLYAEIIDLLRRTAPHDRIPSAESIDATLAWIAVEEAAWLLAESPTITRDALVVGVAKRFVREGFSNQLLASRAAENALLYWEEHRLLERLRIGTREYLTFVHMNLGEYAAARAVAGLTDAKLTAWLTRVRRQPQWREVILLAASAGASEQIARVLLDLDDAADPTSEEAFLAAECLEDVGAPDLALVERAIDRVGARLGSHAEIRAAEVLVRLARFAPSAVSRASLPLLEAKSPVTRLAAEAGVFAGDKTLVPAGSSRRWLEEYLPIQRIFFGKHRPKRISPLPEEASELQQMTACLAVNSLFRVSSRDEAVAVVRNFLPRASTLHLNDLQSVLLRHNAHDLIEPLISDQVGRLMQSMPKFDTPEDRDELLALLDAIATAVGLPEEDEDATAHTLPLLSRILGALSFWQLNLHRLDRRDDQRSLELVVDRVLRGMRTDRHALRRELASGYRAARALTGRGIYAHIREVAVRVNWRTAAAEPIDADSLISALVHPSNVVTYVAAELLENGAAGNSAGDVIAGALAKGRRFTCDLVVQVAPKVIGVDAAADLVRVPLRNDGDRPWRLRGIFEGLERSAGEWKNALYGETIAALTHSKSFVAAAAADALEAMNCPCNAKHVATIREAWTFWSDHNAWCERCDLEVVGRFCSKCHFGIETPRASLVRQLVRCGGLTDVELQPLLSTDDPDVNKAAKEASEAMTRQTVS